MNKPNPFIHKFKTKTKNYVYDINTNRIISVDSIIYDLIEKVGSYTTEEILDEFTNKYSKEQIITALNEIKELNKSHNLFSTVRPSSIKSVHDFQSVKESIEHNLHNMVLGVTKVCNLGCKYCAVSQGKTKTNENTPTTMTFDIAKQAIDYFIAHSTHQQRPIGLGFYGGEPFLAFDLLKKSVTYFKKQRGDRPHLFGITTNATLLDDKKIDFLVNNNFGVLISLDGPEDIHDKHRMFKSGGGTFSTVMKNVEKIRKNYPDYFYNMVFFSCVMVPPLDVTRLHEFFLPLRRSVTMSLVDTWGRESSDFNIIDWQLSGVDEVLNKFKKDILEHKYQKADMQDFDFFAYSFCIDFIRKIYLRRHINQPKTEILTEALCIPGGTSKLYVSPDGKFYVCEKVIGNANMQIGDVWKGIDPKYSFKLMTEFYKTIGKDCCTCWAVHLCTMCFPQVVHSSRFDRKKQQYHCNMIRNGFDRMLVLSFSIFEKDRDAFRFLVDLDQDKKVALRYVDEKKEKSSI